MACVQNLKEVNPRLDALLCQNVYASESQEGADPKRINVKDFRAK